MCDYEPPLIKTLRQLMARPPKVGGATFVEQFVLRYIFFEAALRQVLVGYRLVHPVNGKSSKSDERIQINVVSNCLSHFAIAIPPDTIDILLASKLKTRGAKSARNLRNGLVHEWNAEDAAEVESRGLLLLSHLSKATSAISGRLPTLG